MDEPDDEQTTHFNCRCEIIYIEIPWRAEIHSLLDRHVGDTNPELVLHPRGILHA